MTRRRVSFRLWFRTTSERLYNNPGPAYEVYVNEGPATPKKGNKLFVAYSASGCWTPYYCLGLLTADAGSDLLDPASWKKSPQPVFQQSLCER